MGLFDGLAGQLGALLKGEGGQDAPSMLSNLLSESGAGGLQGLLSNMQQAGLGEHVASWLGNGSNMPISADQLRTVLSEPVVQSIANRLGLPVDGALKLLAEHLPAAVDQASPDGTVQG